MDSQVTDQADVCGGGAIAMRTGIDPVLVTGVDGGDAGVSGLCVVLMNMADATAADVDAVEKEEENGGDGGG
ncbi:hypothetical protein SprV_0301205200 [Sparganum proliferum]